MRKALSIILTVSCAIVALAQDASWYKFPVFNEHIDAIEYTSGKVYYVSNGFLFSFSPDDNESYAYNSINSISDDKVKDLYYNYEKDYLLVVYTTSNIDLIYPDGRIINLPDIKDSDLSVDKTVNDVAFGEDRIAVATNFGIVIFDDTRYEVIESGLYNGAINTVAIMNGHLLVYGHYVTGFSVMAAPLTGRHNTLDKFKKIGGWSTHSFTPIDDEYLLVVDHPTMEISRHKIDFNTYTWTHENPATTYVVNDKTKATKAGVIAFTNDKIIRFNKDSEESFALPSQIHGSCISVYNDPNKIWASDGDGISNMDISGSTPTVFFSKISYPHCMTDERVGYMRWSADGRRLYTSNLEGTRYRSYSTREGSSNYQTTNVIEDGIPRDVSLKKASADHKYAVDYQAKFNNTRMYGEPTWMIEDPDDPDKYYCGNYFEGLYVIKRNPSTGEYEELCKFTDTNSPITPNWGQRVLDVNIDPYGNLWMAYQFGNMISVLPADKRKADPKSITAADWKTYTKLESYNYGAKDMMLLICKKSNMVFLVAGDYEKGFIAIDTKGTYDNPLDDKIYYWDKVTDQDGNLITFTYHTFLIEDQRGCVWVGTSSGVFEITNPSQATDPSMRIRRIKVPRNDGTNYADYLLDSDMINYIAVDPSDRKWIATDASGLFLVSESGDQIIRQFDTTNSPLPSNTVCAVECDKSDNTVYVGTTVGLYSFKSDSSPGHADYSDIYAYPNPVRPEYSGLVTITGLKDNSVVKITDAAGNVVHEARSEGGMATWDACYRGGERVRSGVYYVYASENNSGSASGAVTKIMVIN